MGNVFGAEKPLNEVVRENQRLIKKSIRELEKEIRTMENNMKKLENDIKKNAKANQMVSGRIYVNLLDLTSQPSLYVFHFLFIIFVPIVECCEDYGERLRSDEGLYH